jgi:hypothetical protein
MLVSCAVCRRLHEPLRPLELNPVCALCAADGTAAERPASLEDAELES